MLTLQLTPSGLGNTGYYNVSDCSLTHLHCISWRLLPMFINAYSHINCFRTVLVAYEDAVLSRILHADDVDGDGAAFGLLSDGKMILVKDLPVITKPEDLWGWFAIDEARQTQRLRRGGDDKYRMTGRRGDVCQQL